MRIFLYPSEGNGFRSSVRRSGRRGLVLQGEDEIPDLGAIEKQVCRLAPWRREGTRLRLAILRLRKLEAPSVDRAKHRGRRIAEKMLGRCIERRLRARAVVTQVGGDIECR